MPRLSPCLLSNNNNALGASAGCNRMYYAKIIQ